VSPVPVWLFETAVSVFQYKFVVVGVSVIFGVIPAVFVPETDPVA
jgi:hypothetical protein